MSLLPRRPDSSFVAIDFETADNGRDSACSVALVRVEHNTIVDRAYYLIRPPRERFLFTYIHGITWRQVAHERSFGELWPELHARLQGVEFIAAHNAPFDKGVLNACCRAAAVAAPLLPFVCTVRLARSTWQLYPTKLPDVCGFLDIPLKHHDALSDAEACARIVISARRPRPASKV